MLSSIILSLVMTQTAPTADVNNDSYQEAARRNVRIQDKFSIEEAARRNVRI